MTITISSVLYVHSGEARDEFVQDLAVAVRSRRHSAPRPTLRACVRSFALDSREPLRVRWRRRSLERPAFLSRSGALGSRQRQRQGQGRRRGTPSDRQYHPRYSSVCQRIRLRRSDTSRGAFRRARSRRSSPGARSTRAGRRVFEPERLATLLACADRGSAWMGDHGSAAPRRFTAAARVGTWSVLSVLWTWRLTVSSETREFRQSRGCGCPSRSAPDLTLAAREAVRATLASTLRSTRAKSSST